MVRLITTLNVITCTVTPRSDCLTRLQLLSQFTPPRENQCPPPLQQVAICPLPASYCWTLFLSTCYVSNNPLTPSVQHELCLLVRPQICVSCPRTRHVDTSVSLSPRLSSTNLCCLASESKLKYPECLGQFGSDCGV